MGFVSKRRMRNAEVEAGRNPDASPTLDAVSDLTNGALDTLSCVIRIIGDESFTLESDAEAVDFRAACADFARHVENGAAVPAYDIEPTETGRREWSSVQRFMVEHRRQESRFVSERISGYRSIVDDLVSGLREIGKRDQATEGVVRECLDVMQQAIIDNQIPQVKVALADTITKVNNAFNEQRLSYEAQLKDLNDRMSNLRQDLVSVREEMKRDALTQAFNRGAFDAAIVQSINMHFFSRQPVSLLMVDLDNFKYVNDTHGHSTGDAALRFIGECLARSFIRKNDLVARYGGDEFAVILADTEAKDAAKLVERFLDTVREAEIETTRDATNNSEEEQSSEADREETINLSCSVGYTELLEEDTVQTFVNRADAALFMAKANGRDQSACL